MERLVRLIPLFCAGCAQLFGIEDTTGTGGGASLELQRASIGTTVVKAPLDLTDSPVFLVPSSNASGVTPLTGTPTIPGTWAVNLTGTVGATFTPPDLPKRQEELALGDRQSANHIIYEHPNPEPAAAAMLMMNVTLPGTYSATQTLQVVAIGAWTAHTLGGSELPAVNTSTITSTLDYTMFTPMTSSPAAKITKSDQVLVLRYSGANLTGELIAPTFDQTTADPITGTMAQLTPTTPFDAKIDLAAASTRFGMQQPAVTTFGASWRLDASPGYELGSTVGVPLLGASLAMTDTTFSSMYANPFAMLGYKPMLTYSASQARTAMVGTVSTTFGSTLATVTDPGAGLTLGFGSGLPTSIALDNNTLSIDGAMVTVDTTRALGVDLVVDHPGDLYTVAVEELTVAGAAVTEAPVISVAALDTHITLPPSIFQAGHTYIIVATCISGGYPNAAAGDVATFALPISYGSATSAVFTVASL
jgi:hypothetical protein